MWIRFLPVVVGLVALAQPVMAQSWSATVQEDDFGDKDVGIALTEREGRGFGLRCTKGSAPALVFLTREQWVDSLAIIPAKLLIKVDEGKAFSLQATLEGFDGGNAFRQAQLVRAVTDDDDVSTVLSEIETAKSRVSVAVEIGDQRFEATRFSVRGSTKAISKIRPYCDTEPAS